MQSRLFFVAPNRRRAGFLFRYPKVIITASLFVQARYSIPPEWMDPILPVNSEKNPHSVATTRVVAPKVVAFDWGVKFLPGAILPPLDWVVSGAPPLSLWYRYVASLGRGK